MLLSGAVGHRQCNVRLRDCPELVLRQELAHRVVRNAVGRLEDATVLFQIYRSRLVWVLRQLNAASAGYKQRSKLGVLRFVKKVKDLSREECLSRWVLIELRLGDGEVLFRDIGDVV